MFASPPMSEWGAPQGEILHVAREVGDAFLATFLDRQPQLAASGYGSTLVAPESVELTRLQERLPTLNCVAVPWHGKEYSLWRMLRPLIASHRYAILHAHDLSAAGHASLACLGTAQPFVVSLHERVAETAFGGVVGSLQRCLLGRALARATVLIAAGEEIRVSLLRRFPNLRPHLHKILTIPDGMDTAPFRDDCPVPLSLRTAWNLDEQTFLVGCVPGPHTAAVTEAAARLKRFQGVPAAHMVTPEPDDLASSRVWLEQLDLLVLLHDDARSIRLAQEGLCVGVPILARSRPAMREVLRDSPSLFIDAHLPTALEVALRQSLSQPWFAEAAAYAGRACDRFCRHRFVEQQCRVYEQLIRPEVPSLVGVLAAGG